MIEDNKPRKYVPHIRNRLEDIEDKLMAMEKLFNEKCDPSADDVDYMKSIQVIYGLINDTNDRLDAHMATHHSDTGVQDSLRNSIRKNLDRLDSMVNYLSMLMFILIILQMYILFIR